MTTDDLALAIRLADAAGAAIRPLFRGEWAHERKADASPVTEADRAAEAAMRAILEAERPDDGIIGEEYGTAREGAGRQWVLDPIDGTVSFMAGRPIFGTLIALMQGRLAGARRDRPADRRRTMGWRDRRRHDAERQAGRGPVLQGTVGRDARLHRPQHFDEGEAAAFMSLASRTSQTVVWVGTATITGFWPPAIST